MYIKARLTPAQTVHLTSVRQSTDCIGRLPDWCCRSITCNPARGGFCRIVEIQMAGSDIRPSLVIRLHTFIHYWERLPVFHNLYDVPYILLRCLFTQLNPSPCLHQSLNRNTRSAIKDNWQQHKQFWPKYARGLCVSNDFKTNSVTELVFWTTSNRTAIWHMHIISPSQN